MSHLQMKEAESRDRARVVTRCARCPWRFTGTAVSGRERYAEHRAGGHS